MVVHHGVDGFLDPGVPLLHLSLRGHELGVELLLSFGFGDKSGYCARADSMLLCNRAMQLLVDQGLVYYLDLLLD